MSLRVNHSEWHGAEITVHEGQELHQDFDVTPLRPVHLDLLVMVDGSPYDGNVNWVAWHAVGRSGQRMGTSGLEHTGSEGHLLLDTFGGAFTCNLYLPSETADRQIVTAPAFTVPAGGEVRQRLDVALVRTSLQVSRPGGGPAADLEVALAQPGADRDLWFVFHGDHAGRVPILLATAGRWQLLARPRSLGTEASRDQFAAQHGWPALRSEWIEVAPIDLAPGVAAPVRVQLPPSWDR